MPNRLTTALRVLFGGTKALALFQPTWMDGRPSYSEVRFESLAKEGYRKNELIFACITKTANTAAQVQVEVHRQGDEKPIEAHPLKTLLKQPNPYMSEFDFWSAVIVFQKLAGVAYFEKERSNGGQVIRLWPLRPDWVAPIPDAREKIRGYEFTVPGMQPVTLRPEDVLDFPLFDPLNQYRGYPPAAVAGRVGDVDNAATDYLKVFFEKGGTPPGLLTTTQRLLDPAVTDIRRRWRERYGGYSNWLEPAVLDSDAKYQQIGLNFNDMGFDVLDGRDEARICMVLQVPPILIGAKIGLDRATYSNYAEARKAWWQDDLLPLYASFQDVLDQGLAPEFGDNLEVKWNFDKVPALQEERNARWTRATAALSAGGITVNEFCAEVGLEDKGAAGEFFLRSSSMVEVPAQEGVRPEPEPQPVQLIEQPEPEEEGEPEDEEMDNEQAGKSMEHKAANPPDEQVRRKHERVIVKAMQAYLSEQMDQAIEEAASGA